MTVAANVTYSLLVNGQTTAEDGYVVLEGRIEKRLPPMIIITAYEVSLKFEYSVSGGSWLKPLSL